MSVSEALTLYNQAVDNAIKAMSPTAKYVTLGISIVIIVAYIVASWMVFKKAGQAGWKCLIPFYSTYIEFKIICGNGWKMFLCLIPVFGIFYAFVSLYRFAESFEHGAGFAFGLWMLPAIFVMILGFGPSQYIGPQGVHARERLAREAEEEYEEDEEYEEEYEDE